ncbi:MAG: M20/M25/M40 family metallo-hydrolase [Thermoanaerobaculia bacterium]|nr:M20/M25/M40 family metallo-hydrolase [Thermoanaerobaculia bacterium]
MPGESHRGELPPLTGEEERTRDSLERYVRILAEEIGERNLWRPGSLDRTATFLEETLVDLGLPVDRQCFDSEDREVCNLEARVASLGASDEIVVVGAHYDTVPGSPGANDNGSGVAALLELARLLEAETLARTVRLVAFVNEEAPFYHGPDMGSRRYARRCRERSDRITAMLSLETIAYYSDEEGSQSYPFPLGLFYPDRGDFIGFVGNLSSLSLVRKVVGSFRSHTRFPSEGTAAPAVIPGISWSDHWSFWQEGYPALMVTDTAPYRDPGYHTPGDTPGRLDFARTARVVHGLHRVVRDLADSGEPGDA